MIPPQHFTATMRFCYFDNDDDSVHSNYPSTLTVVARTIDDAVTMARCRMERETERLQKKFPHEMYYPVLDEVVDAKGNKVYGVDWDRFTVAYQEQVYDPFDNLETVLDHPPLTLFALDAREAVAQATRVAQTLIDAKRKDQVTEGRFVVKIQEVYDKNKQPQYQTVRKHG